MSYFQINNQDIQQLSIQDPILAQAIHRIGPIKRATNPDLFAALISSVVGQQISTKAALTVNKRLEALVDTITPQTISHATVEAIQQCGMSFKKAENIKQIGHLFFTQAYDVEMLKKLDDETFIKEMIKIKGIGTWTAEMLLIHTLMRNDIISYKDLGILRGMKILYGLRSISKKEFNMYKQRYSPYASIASIYLWEISSQSITSNDNIK